MKVDLSSLLWCLISIEHEKRIIIDWQMIAKNKMHEFALCKSRAPFASSSLLKTFACLGTHFFCFPSVSHWNSPLHFRTFTILSIIILNYTSPPVFTTLGFYEFDYLRGIFAKVARHFRTIFWNFPKKLQFFSFVCYQFNQKLS